MGGTKENVGDQGAALEKQEAGVTEATHPTECKLWLLKQTLANPLFLPGATPGSQIQSPQRVKFCLAKDVPN